MEEKLMRLLKQVSDSYKDFAIGAFVTARNEDAIEPLILYIQNNPDAKSDDILDFLDEFGENN